MKKFYSLVGIAATALSLSVNTSAQQLANSGFEEAWGDCVPWTFYGNDGSKGELSQVVTGVTPADWIISNVSGMTTNYEGSAMGLGATEVGEKVEGYESESAVKLTNTANPFMASQIVPAYISLGTTWSTANPAFSWTGISINNSDGGAFGGVAFSERPTGIEFMYKRSRGTDKPEEKSTVVAYLWKGHWTQKDVPSIIYMAGDPVYADMVDRDRCVLGMDMAGCQGGEVSKTDDAELIAVLTAEITEDASEWTKFTGKFDYKSDATPEMINVIIASGDYFGGASVVGEGNSLIVDDVKLLYDEILEGDVYPGQLTIEMMGGMLTEEPVGANVTIQYDSDDKCTLVLPNFTLDLGSGPANLGDIVVPDVVVAIESAVAKYTGKVEGLSLMDGQIIADVTLDGTIDADGNANLIISVLWEGIPINVNFVGKGLPGKGTSGISGIAADLNAQIEYYTINGVKVNAANLTPGIYVVRQGNKAHKAYIR